MEQFVMVIGSYLAVIIIGFGIVNFLSQGYLLSFIRVKMSRGKLILVRIKDLVQRKYSVGRLDENYLSFKYAGKKKLYTLTERAVFREMGVTVIDVDVVRNIAFTDNYEATIPYDSEKMQNLYVRCLTRPELQDKMDKIILILIIAILGGLVLLWFNLTGIGDRIELLAESVRVLSESVAKEVV